MTAALVLLTLAVLWHEQGEKALTYAYVFNVLVALDQLANALCGGSPDETISARAYRSGWVRRQALINWVFRDKDHCMQAYISEVLRKQLPPEYTKRVEQ